MRFLFLGSGEDLSAPLVLHFDAVSPGAACAGAQRVLDAVEACERAEILAPGCRIELVRGGPPRIGKARAA